MQGYTTGHTTPQATPHHRSHHRSLHRQHHKYHHTTGHTTLQSCTKHTHTTFTIPTPHPIFPPGIFSSSCLEDHPRDPSWRELPSPLLAERAASPSRLSDPIRSAIPRRRGRMWWFRSSLGFKRFPKSKDRLVFVFKCGWTGFLGFSWFPGVVLWDKARGIANMVSGESREGADVEGKGSWVLIISSYSVKI